jgi:seryl-tRNA synthetase
MHDIKFLRANADLVKEHLANKQIGDGAALVDEVLQLDEQRRNALFEVEQLKKQRNEASQQVAKLKKSGEDATQIIEETRHLGDRIGALDADSREIEAVLGTSCSKFPTFTRRMCRLALLKTTTSRCASGARFRSSVSSRSRTGKSAKPAHHRLRARRKVAARVFTCCAAPVRDLERALISLMLDVHTQQHGYEEVLPPFLVRPEAMTGAVCCPSSAKTLITSSATICGSFPQRSARHGAAQRRDSRCGAVAH